MLTALQFSGMWDRIHELSIASRLSIFVLIYAVITNFWGVTNHENPQNWRLLFGWIGAVATATLGYYAALITDLISRTSYNQLRTWLSPVILLYLALPAQFHKWEIQAKTRQVNQLVQRLEQINARPDLDIAPPPSDETDTP